MLLSHSHRFVFLKPPKTAGSSVEAALRTFCLPPQQRQSSSEHVFPETVTDYGIVTVSGNRTPTGSPLKPHMSIHEAEELIGRNRFSQYLKVSITRNPFDRAVSLFWWNLWQNDRDGYDRLQECSERELRRKFRDFTVKKRRIIQWARLKRFTHPRLLGGNFTVLRYESLEEDLRDLVRKLGGDPTLVTLPGHKTGIRPKGLLTQEYFGAIASTTIRWEWREDFLQHGYSWDLKAKENSQ